MLVLDVFFQPANGDCRIVTVGALEGLHVLGRHVLPQQVGGIALEKHQTCFLSHKPDSTRHKYLRWVFFLRKERERQGRKGDEHESRQGKIRQTKRERQIWESTSFLVVALVAQELDSHVHHAHMLLQRVRLRTQGIIFSRVNNSRICLQIKLRIFKQVPNLKN